MKQRHIHQKQNHFKPYAILLLLSIIFVFFWGLSLVSSSARIVHAIQDMEQDNRVLSLQITEEESYYHEQIENSLELLSSSTHSPMVSYSARDEHVRYAQVGGLTYSVVSSGF